MGGKVKQDKECALQISGLSATASEATLMNVFRPFGSIVRIALNGMNGAHVVFSSKNHAHKAIKATHGAVFEGKPMSVTMVPTFRKTVRPCKKYQAGRCTMGDQCKYYHQDAGTPLPEKGATAAAAEPMITAETPVGVQAIPNSVICTHFTRGFCSSGSSCRFAHVLGGSKSAGPPVVVKKRPCLYFAAGMCTRGDDCTFVHEGQENAAASTPATLAASAPVTPTAAVVAATPAAGSNKRPCTYFAAGMCTRGEQCLFSHDAPAATSVVPVAAAAKPACSYFAAGLCTRGEQCLFSHVTPVATAAAPVAVKEKKSKEKKTKTKTAPVPTTTETTDTSADSRTCIECEQVGVAVWQCANCDDALYCDACNAAVHKARVMTKHVRAKLPPVVKKPKNPKCGECEQTEASVQCTDCEMPYCDACDASVHRFKSLRMHTREQFSAASSAATVASKKSKKQAAATPAPPPPAVEYIESVPKYEITSDSETESDDVNGGKESDSESDDDDIPPQIPAHIPPQSVVQLPLPTRKAAPAPVPVRKQSISSESSDDDDIPAVPTPVKAKAVVPVRKQSVSSESSDDDDVPARTAPAAAQPTNAKTTAAPVALSEESSSDFDDERPVVKPAAPVVAALAKKQVTPVKPAAKVASSSSSESSSSSSSESSDDEDVKMATPVVQQQPQQQQQRARPAPAASSSMNGKRGISEGSTHSLVRKIEAYKESDNSEVLHLDANLNGFERLLAHDCAERLGLHHVSVGEGLERHITISRASSSNKRPAPAGANGHNKRQK